MKAPPLTLHPRGSLQGIQVNETIVYERLRLQKMTCGLLKLGTTSEVTINRVSSFNLSWSSKIQFSTHWKGDLSGSFLHFVQENACDNGESCLKELFKE